MSVQSSLVMHPIYTYGSEAQKDRWLEQLGRQIFEPLNLCKILMSLLPFPSKGQGYRLFCM